jgi:hypothetical protein
METLLRISGALAGIALLLWLPLTFFVGCLLFSELKPESRKGRYWAFPIFIRRAQLAPYGVKLLSFYRFPRIWIFSFLAGRHGLGAAFPMIRL